MRVLGIDLGTKRIGLAMSDAGGVIATPHLVLERSSSPAADHRAIKEIVDEWEVERIIVGLPLSLDGSVGPAARQALQEVDRLAAATGVRVEPYDERLTTVTAHQILREQGVAGPDRRTSVDKVAAAVLLQSWLDGHKDEAVRDEHSPDTPDTRSTSP